MDILQSLEINPPNCTNDVTPSRIFICVMPISYGGNELLVRQRYHLDHKFMQILGALAPQTKIAPLY